MTATICKSSVSFWCSIRITITFLGFLGMIIHSLQKVNVAIALICMVNHSAIEQNGSISMYMSKNNDCPEIDNGNNIEGPYIWSKKIQGIILGAYFWGYIITQIPSGYLSARFGPKFIFGGSMFVSSLVTMFIPLIAKVHWIGFCILRFLIGFCHGTVWPCMIVIMAHWAPKHERGRLMGFMNAGAQVGNILAFSTGGLMCSWQFVGGWPLIFYSSGIFGLVWSIVWMLFYTNSPKDHRFISRIEKEFILENTEKKENNEDNNNFNAPWRLILSSSTCWSLFIVHTCINWGIYTFQTSIPKYMNEVLKFDITSNGFLSTLPYFILWLFIILSGFLADMIIRKNLLTRTNTRKVFNTIGNLVSAIFIIGLAFLTCRSKYLAVGLLTVGVAFNGCCYGGGFLLVANDIASVYAGIVFGISNTLGAIPGIVSPYIVGILTEKDPTNWRIVFFICAAIYSFGMIVFLIFGSSELQSWAKKLDNYHISHKNSLSKQNGEIDIKIINQ